MPDPLLIAKNPQTELFLLPALANRHGLVTGATGTGKTVTLQVMAERFSAIGVPVFLADVKGDLSGITQPGAPSPKLQERLKRLGMDEPAYGACPAVFWDVFGEQGHPIRATVSDLGPLLLSRVLNLNETQTGVLALVFKVADDNGLLLLDLKDLRAMLQHVADHAQELQTKYGNVSAASVGAIQRGLLALEQQGAEKFIGEPMLNIDDLLQTGAGGRGVVNILVADKLLNAPTLYSTLLLWLLSELYERLPEVGEALVSFLDANGRPGIVERAYVVPPTGRMGPATAEERQRILADSALAGVYDKPVDRESAYERLKGRAEASAPAAAAPEAHAASWTDSLKDSLGGLLSGSGRKDSLVEAAAKSAVRTVGSTIGREIVRGVLGSLMGGRKR